MPAVEKSRGSKSVEVERVWEVFDDRLQFMSRQDALLLDECLNVGDVSQAWLVWSRAAETALADAYQFSGGPVPHGGLVLGHGKALFKLVGIRSGRCVVMLPLCMMPRTSSCTVIPLLLLCLIRRFRAVISVLDPMISHNVTLSRSVELTAQWGRILSLGPLHTIVLDDFHAVEGFCF